MPDAYAKLLIDAVSRLAATSSLEEVQHVVRSAARAVADADGATFVLRDGDRCFYADEDAVSPLWKGQRFPLEACISGWAMLHRRHVAIPDIYADDRIPHDAYRPTFVKSLLMTPIRSAQPLGAIGVYWGHQHEPTELQISLLQALADSTALAIDSLAVRERMLIHAAEADRVAREARTDELTGVHNRRGFFHEAERRLADARTAREPSVLGFFDIDGLKAVNDSWGHEAGSRLVCDAADALVDAFGRSGVVARMGGDEFAVLLPCCSEPVPELLTRLRAAVAAAPGLQLSAGLVTSPAHDDRELTQLIQAADAAMYEDKREAGDAAATRPVEV